MLNGITGLIGSALDKLFPDKGEANKHKLALLELEQQGALTELTRRYDAIIAEAQSKDPWTSRARPSFLYVIYAMILFGIPMGIVSAVSVETATAIAAGTHAWLQAIPSELYALFGAGYLGYTYQRSQDKKLIAKTNMH